MLAQQPKSFFLPYLKNILCIHESFLPLLLIGFTLPQVPQLLFLAEIRLLIALTELCQRV